MEKYYCFFDTETSGLPNDYNLPFYKDLKNFPRIVSLSWILTNDKGNELSRGDLIIKPNGFKIDKGSIKTHGITDMIAMQKGVDLEFALRSFLTDYRKFDNTVLVAHNMNFDYNVLFSELQRTWSKLNWEYPIKKICTMLSLVDFCKIEGYYGYKWAKLQELHNILFNESFDNAHNSMADTEALKRDEAKAALMANLK